MASPPGLRGRIGFRTQLAALIALTIALTGGAVLGAMYVVVANELGVTLWVSDGGPGASGQVIPTAPPTTVATEGTNQCSGASCPSITAVPGPSGSGAATGDAGTVNGQRVEVLPSTTSEVLRRTLLWVGAIIIVLTALSSALGWWLSGRLLRRVTEITRAARSVSEGDLSARLDLPGPKDEITELADTFDAMMARLEASMSSQRRFVANASHELRTPLATTRLALEAPLTQGVLTGEARVAAERALGSVKVAAERLTALLELASARDADADLDTVDLALLTAEAIDDEHATHATPADRFTVDLRPALTLGDPALIGRAVHNLVRNAVVHSPADSRITVATWSHRTTAGIEITNDGEVIGSTSIAELVEPFHRGTDSRLRGRAGSGLGLSIVQAVADRFDGRLTLAARPTGGMTATLEFSPVSGLTSDDS